MSFDWEKYWKDTDESISATNFAKGMADRFIPLFYSSTVSTFADFGCGPATMIFKLAETYPDTVFYGYDLSEAVIEKNTMKAREQRLDNIYFKKENLPYLETRLSFDVISCFSTLHYLETIEAAIVNLFGLVTPAGYLVFNYPNIYTRRIYQRDLSPDDHVMRTRFKTLLAGHNLLTQKKIAELLGVTPRKFYCKIKGNIYVIIRKQRRHR